MKSGSELTECVETRKLEGDRTPAIGSTSSEPIVFEYELRVDAKERSVNEGIQGHSPGHESPIRQINNGGFRGFRSPSRLLHCHSCSYTTKLKSLMRRHVKLHLPEGDFVCPKCDFRDGNSRAFAKHVISHGTPKRAMHCCFCSFTTQVFNSFPQHLRIHRSVGSFYCEKCDFSCVQKNSLLLHNKRQHVEKHNCPCCPKVGTRFRISLHVKKCHPDFWPMNRQLMAFPETASSPNAEAPQEIPSRAPVDKITLQKQCKLCEFTTLRKDLLELHEAKHAPLECPVCDLQVSNGFNFALHLSKHNPQEQPYKCFYCGDVTKNVDHLYRHLSVHISALKTHDCALCTFSCLNNKYLQLHMSTHSEESNFDGSRKSELMPDFTVVHQGETIKCLKFSDASADLSLGPLAKNNRDAYEKFTQYQGSRSKALPGPSRPDTTLALGVSYNVSSGSWDVKSAAHKQSNFDDNQRTRSVIVHPPSRPKNIMVTEASEIVTGSVDKLGKLAHKLPPLHQPLDPLFTSVPETIRPAETSVLETSKNVSAPCPLVEKQFSPVHCEVTQSAPITEPSQPDKASSLVVVENSKMFRMQVISQYYGTQYSYIPEPSRPNNTLASEASGNVVIGSYDERSKSSPKQPPLYQPLDFSLTTIPKPTRLSLCGTQATFSHSGTQAIFPHSGTQAILSHSGTQAILPHSGTQATFSHSGTQATLSHSSTLATLSNIGAQVKLPPNTAPTFFDSSVDNIHLSVLGDATDTLMPRDLYKSYFPSKDSKQP